MTIEQRTSAIAFSLGLLFCLASNAPLIARADDATPPTAERAYVDAVGTMRSLVNPPFATYESTWQSTGLGFDFVQLADRVGIEIGFGSSFLRNERHLVVAYRASGRTIAMRDDDGTTFVGRSRLMEPTWAGAYDTLQHGFGGSSRDDALTAPSPSPAVPATLQSSTPQSPAPQSPAPISPGRAASAPALEASDSASPTAGLENIASVSAIAPRYYRVSDEGMRPCRGLGDGRALHLVARDNARAHPLTDVVLDPSTGRFCSMTFVIKESGLAGVTGIYTIDFAPFGNYWLVSDGFIDVNVRLFGIAAKRATLSWQLSKMATPDSVPDTTFVLPSPSPAPAKH